MGPVLRSETRFLVSHIGNIAGLWAGRGSGLPRAGNGGGGKWLTGMRRTVTLGLLFAVVVTGYQHRAQIAQSLSQLAHVRSGWLVIAVVAEAASMAVFGRMQGLLLEAGGVRVGAGPMVEISVAANAMSTSLPGGTVWSATWEFGQLRQRGADRPLAVWVLLVAGALSSYALFIVVVAGAWVAGGHGPLAQLRWLGAFLFALPVGVAGGYLGARRSVLARMALARLSSRASSLGPATKVGDWTAGAMRTLRWVRPGRAGWAQALALASLNWLYDALCAAACMEALGVPVPWRSLLAIYGLTQIVGSLPITPGGLGVVEASMSALLISYGTAPASAFAAVVLYRIVSFWGLVPIGWGAWLTLELTARAGPSPHDSP